MGIQHPRDPVAFLRVVTPAEGSLVTSGDYERYFDEGGVRYHHILDPRTGDSARLLRSATVIGPSATRTDALSTSLFVMGARRGLEMINGLKDVDAIVVTPEGKVLYSEGLAPP